MAIPEGGSGPWGAPTLLDVPLDENSSYKRGAAAAPPLIRDALTSESSNMFTELGVDVGAEGAYDEGCEVELGSDDPFEAIQKAVSALLEKRRRPVCLGGDHSITYPILRALGKDRPVGMVHIDAHCDTAGVFEGSKFHHGGPFRHAVLDGVLDPERSIQIGIRGGAEFLWEFSFESGMTVLHVDEVAEMGVRAVVEKARKVIGDGPTYVSFDVDGIDPAFAPGTGTPEVGGLTPREALAIVRGIAGAHIVGADVVEVAPQYDATTNTAHVAAQMLFTELCLVALDPKRESRRSG